MRAFRYLAITSILAVVRSQIRQDIKTTGGTVQATDAAKPSDDNGHVAQRINPSIAKRSRVKELHIHIVYEHYNPHLWPLRVGRNRKNYGTEHSWSERVYPKKTVSQFESSDEEDDIDSLDSPSRSKSRLKAARLSSKNDSEAVSENGDYQRKRDSDVSKERRQKQGDKPLSALYVVPAVEAKASPANTTASKTTPLSAIFVPPTPPPVVSTSPRPPTTTTIIVSSASKTQLGSATNATVIVDKKCPVGQHWDNVKQACLVSIIPTCPTAQHWDKREKACVSTVRSDCPAGQFWDFMEAACVAALTPACPKFRHWDRTEKACVASTKDNCPKRQYWDAVEKVCDLLIKPGCPKGQHWDRIEKACIVSSKANCPNYFYWDPQEKECIAISDQQGEKTVGIHKDHFLQFVPHRRVYYPVTYKKRQE